MEPTSNETNPREIRLRFTSPDGVVTEGTAAQCQAWYAAAGFQGSISRHVPAPVVAAAPVVQPGDVDQAAAPAVQASLDFIQARYSVTAPRPWYKPGTEMMQIGKDTFRARAKLHADRSPMEEEFRAVADQVDAEQRGITPPMDSSKLRITPDLKLTRVGSGLPPLPLDPNALEQLFSRASVVMPGPLGRMLRTLPADRFAALVNDQLADLERVIPDPEKRLVRVQYRTLDGVRQGFSVVTPSYLPMPLPSILAAYVDQFRAMGLPDPRAQVTYNPATTAATIKASWHAPETFDAHVGDGVEVGINGRTDDRGGSSHHGDLCAWLIQCINCTIMTWAINSVARRHRGSRHHDHNVAGLARIQSDVAAIVGGSEDGIRHYLDRWGVLRTAPIDAVLIGGKRRTDPRKAIEAMVIAGDITADIGRDALTEAMLSAFDDEPGESLADLVNAVTRAAHQRLVDDCAQWQLERAAGNLMMAWADQAEGVGVEA